MEPKFQSSFIPKGPAVSTTTTSSATKYKPAGRSFFGFIAVTIFVISVLLALGMFGYKFYLDYNIKQMSAELDNAWTTLEPDVIRELTRLDSRIISTQSLIASHQIITPLFEFLEDSTPVTVRFRDFKFGQSDLGMTLSMGGEARGFTALAFVADIFNGSKYFKNVIFSDFQLNDKGNVTFSLKAVVDPSLVSYKRSLDTNNIQVQPQTQPPTPTSVSTTTATTTPAKVTPN